MWDFTGIFRVFISFLFRVFISFLFRMTDISTLYADRKRESLMKVSEKVRAWKAELSEESLKEMSSNGTALQFFNGDGHRVALTSSPSFALLERIATYKKSNKYTPEGAIAQLTLLENIILQQLNEM